MGASLAMPGATTKNSYTKKVDYHCFKAIGSFQYNFKRKKWPSESDDSFRLIYFPQDQCKMQTAEQTF